MSIVGTVPWIDGIRIDSRITNTGDVMVLSSSLPYTSCETHRDESTSSCAHRGYPDDRLGVAAGHRMGRDGLRRDAHPSGLGRLSNPRPGPGRSQQPRLCCLRELVEDIRTGE